MQAATLQWVPPTHTHSSTCAAACLASRCFLRKAALTSTNASCSGDIGSALKAPRPARLSRYFLRSSSTSMLFSSCHASSDMNDPAGFAELLILAMAALSCACVAAAAKAASAPALLGADTTTAPLLSSATMVAIASSACPPRLVKRWKHAGSR